MRVKNKSRLLLCLIVFANTIFFVSCNSDNVLDKPESFTFVQICDPQLGFSDYEKDIVSFQQAVRQINELNADFVVICGDLVNSANGKSFMDFNKMKSGFQMPCYCAPGNHDVGNKPTSESLQYYRKTLGEDHFIVEHKHTTFIFVNTQLWKNPLVKDSEQQDIWLKQRLKVALKGGDQIFIVGHYPLFCEEPNEPEQYMNLPGEKRKELLELFDQYNVAAVLGGHTHRLTLNNYKNIQFVNGETISKNFDSRPLGYRVWHVNDKSSPTHEFVPLEATGP